ncbi:MAG: hypothetical protein INR65_01650 [Gluconacetobacter diazotrophicus]|nr:hypothetical protein [Gluconacetobacter diazotrophicus]
MNTQGRIAEPNGTPAGHGIAVPFTAPSLSGARVRRGQRDLDLLLPNPAGSRGFYVMGWSAVPEVATPSLHDAMLGRALGSLAELGPAAVRGAAREIAAAGYAGREARRAAAAAQDRIAQGITALWRELATGMARDSALPTEQARRLAGGLAEAATHADSPGLQALAARLNWPAVALADALARLARAYVGVTDGGRAMLLLRRIGQLRAAPGTVGRDADRDGTRGGGVAPRETATEQVTAEVDRFVVEARRATEAARAMLASPARLLAVWRSDPGRALAPADRVELLFDGWDRICALWTELHAPAARATSRGPAMAEPAMLIRLAAANMAGSIQPQGAGGSGRDPSAQDATVAALVARNERVRTAELALEHGPPEHVASEHVT